MSGVWGREKPRQAFSRKICEETDSNPRPSDSVKQLSPLHQACPSHVILHNQPIIPVPILVYNLISLPLTDRSWKQHVQQQSRANHLK